MADGESLEARSKKSLAEDLLKATTDTGENARKAVEILLEIDASRRGKMVDELSGKAFENLLERVPDADRERFFQLLAGATRADRKLLLWAEAHKSRAENDVARNKGDAGQDVPLRPVQDEDSGAWSMEIDQEEKDEVEGKYTRTQMINRKRRNRRVAAVETTKQEVDVEVARLMAKALAGELTVADVDQMTNRKDLEYQVELENNISLTSHGTRGPEDHKTQVEWSRSELETLRTTLARLPHVLNPDGFQSIDRQGYYSNWLDGIGGYTHFGKDIDIYDAAMIRAPGFGHGGDKREMVSDEFRRQHGDTISAEELVVTHEIGHDVSRQEPKAFDAMTRASGWTKVKVDELRKDGVTEKDIAKLDQRRTNPNAERGDEIAGNLNTYAPITGGDEYWAVPKTAVPQSNEARLGGDNEDTWVYSKVNPDEQFAETYAKAVHVPETLHDELVDRPTAAARAAEQKVTALQKQIDDLQKNRATPNKEATLARLQQDLASAQQTAKAKDTAKAQRGEEFRVMREDVFHTDKAVAIPVERLGAKKVSAAKLAEFERRAAVASTPEQIAYLERVASK